MKVRFSTILTRGFLFSRARRFDQRSASRRKFPNKKDSIKESLWDQGTFLVEKMKTPVLFDINRPFKRQIYSFLDKRIIYQSFCIAPLTFRNFSSGKSSVYLHASGSRLRNVYCPLLSDKISRRKKLYLQIAHSNGKITLSLSENC